jgi:hypothetical protein
MWPFHHSRTLSFGPTPVAMSFDAISPRKERIAGI